MACPFCHNPDFATGKGKRIGVDDTLEFLHRRRPMLDGVTFSGGECLLSSAAVPMIREVKQMGYAIKIDSNGGKPDRLAELIGEGLVDYVAMDFKAPLELYEERVGFRDVDLWRRSLDTLCRSGIEYELRTTVHPDLLEEAEVDEMLDFLEHSEFRGNYYLQHFQQAPRTLGRVADASRRFDLGRLNLQRPFAIGLRNFTKNESRVLSLKS